jgi:hypothetical protein
VYRYEHLFTSCSLSLLESPTASSELSSRQLCKITADQRDLSSIMPPPAHLYVNGSSSLDVYSNGRSNAQKSHKLSQEEYDDANVCLVTAGYDHTIRYVEPQPWSCPSLPGINTSILDSGRHCLESAHVLFNTPIPKSTDSAYPPTSVF